LRLKPMLSAMKAAAPWALPRAPFRTGS
jgi:hypothetical protein